MSKKVLLEHNMKQKIKTKDFPTKVTIFIEPDGKVIIDNLFANILPVALSLNPDNKRIKKFILNQRKIETIIRGAKNVSLYHNRDKDN